MHRCFFAVTFFMLLAVQAGGAELTGTLKRIADTGEFRIGFVPDAPPMSYLDVNGNAIGYSIDLCRSIAAVAKTAAGIADMKMSYVPLISPEDRLSAVENNKVDIECGATTVTLSRRQRVDFSLFTFITGAAVMSLKSAPVDGIAELGGKTIAVIPGTTTETALRDFVKVNEVGLKLKKIETHNDGMKLLDAGEVDGYASDRAMLVGQVLRSDDVAKYAITRDVFSLEPYALMIQKGDTDFRLVVDRALARLYRSVRIRRIYHDWFGRYGAPMSPMVSGIYEYQAVAE